ncbi:MAG: DUF2726 domain-containing protein [Neptuniibacter sp.]
MTDPILILSVVAALGLALLLVLLKKRTPEVTQQTSTSLHERMFFPVLEKAVGGRFDIVCKVPVSEVLAPQNELPKRAQRKVLNSIKGHLFDYVVVQKDTRRVICVVELDDHKFDKKTFKKQDLYLEQICESSGLPLLRVPSQRGYDLAEIIERFERTIEAASKIETSPKNKLAIKEQFSTESQS